MIRILIVDDEKKSRESLRMLINEFCDDIEVAGDAATISDAVKQINIINPDIVFLDIRMKGETGFDLFKNFEEINFEVIFTTAYSEYAIKAFQFSAIDYLLKPIDYKLLISAIEKSKLRLKTKHFSQMQINTLLDNLKPSTASSCKLALPTSTGLKFVKLNEILYCEGQNNYTVFYLLDETKLLVSKTLKEYEEMLKDHNFFRIHKSYLINLEEIKEYIRGDGGYVVMNNKTSLNVSKRKKEAFLKEIAQTL